MKKIYHFAILSITATITFTTCSGAQKPPKTEPAKVVSVQSTEEPLISPFPTQPFLQLEVGMHFSKINKISSDAAGTYLVTASNDKTIRLFQASDGKLLKTYRAPIGKGEEGRFDAVAISPDSTTIACGGWTGYDWHRSDSIYLFNRESGKMIKRIGHHPGNILAITYSKDGKYLVASMSGTNGIRIYNTIDYSLVKEDRYSDTTMGVDFDENGSLVTISYDKHLRRYDKKFNLINKIYIPDLILPSSVSISPKGDLIAVSDSRNPKVNVYSGSLQYLFSPSIYGYGTGVGIFTVRFSSDGKVLYAGGQTLKITNNERNNNILVWHNSGKGTLQEIPTGNDSIMHLAQSGDKIAFCTADPRFGLVTPSSVVYSIPSVVCDFRTLTDRMQISKNGKTVLFGMKENHKEKAVFSCFCFRGIFQASRHHKGASLFSRKRC